MARKRRRRDKRTSEPEIDDGWTVIDGRRFFVAGYTPNGVPYGIFEDDMDDDLGDSLTRQFAVLGRRTVERPAPGTVSARRPRRWSLRGHLSRGGDDGTSTTRPRGVIRSANNTRGCMASSKPAGRSSRAADSSVGDLRPCSYADSVGRDVPARAARSRWLKPATSTGHRPTNGPSCGSPSGSRTHQFARRAEDATFAPGGEPACTAPGRALNIPVWPGPDPEGPDRPAAAPTSRISTRPTTASGTGLRDILHRCVAFTDGPYGRDSLRDLDARLRIWATT